MADVFLSYRNTAERRALVERLAFIMHAYRIDVWWDYELAAGGSYRDEIARELSLARVVVPLWCSESIHSEWVLSEARLGGAKLVPARLQKVAPPKEFEATHAADLLGWDGAASDPRVAELVRRICERLGRPSQMPVHTQRQLAMLPPVAPLPEVAAGVAPSPSPTAVPTHDYAFWERQWEKHAASSNLVALRAIADDAPRYFAEQAKARIGEIEAEQRHAIAERERQAHEQSEATARQRTEQDRIAKERLAAEKHYRDEGRVRIDAQIVHGAPDGWFKPGNGQAEWFKDIGVAPEMVVVPGNPAFAIGRFALTFAEWDAAQAHPEWQKHSGIAPRKPEDLGWGRGKQPAINVSWDDAKAYCAWLSALTAKTYRLPIEAEWEQACRAGTNTEFWWGNEISTEQANYDGNYTFGNGKKGEYRQRTVPVDSFQANPWGLFQVHGNVWEWCEDAYDASSRVVRGGSWGSNPQFLRSSNRSGPRPDIRYNDLGFRLARTL